MLNFLRLTTYRKFRHFLKWAEVILGLVLLVLKILKFILDQSS